MPIPALSRRSLLSGGTLAVLGGVAGFVVARSSNAADQKPATSTANAYGPGATGGGGHVVTTLSKLPPDGAVVGGLVVTRDAGGSVHAVSATCTHQGCTVGAPHQGVVACPCHGSRFHADTGAVIRGPATRPLPAVAVTVLGDQVIRA